MGEAMRRVAIGGPEFKQLKPGQTIQFDPKNAVQKVCECGCKYFIPVIALYTMSALLSPTGQELTGQQPVLVCMECKKAI